MHQLVHYSVHYSVHERTEVRPCYLRRGRPEQSRENCNDQQHCCDNRRLRHGDDVRESRRIDWRKAVAE